MNFQFLEPYVEYFSSKINSQITIFFSSVFISVLGTILIVLFFTTFLNLGMVLKSLPWIIGFFSALAAYHLIDKTKKKLKRRYLFCFFAGIITAILSYILLDMIFFNLFNQRMLYSYDLMLFTLVSIVCSGIGAKLAIKYFNLKS